MKIFVYVFFMCVMVGCILFLAFMNHNLIENNEELDNQLHELKSIQYDLRKENIILKDGLNNGES